MPDSGRQIIHDLSYMCSETNSCIFNNKKDSGYQDLEDKGKGVLLDIYCSLEIYTICICQFYPKTENKNNHN